MADWHIIHLTFEPELTSKKLEVLIGALREADYDFPVDSLTVHGIQPTRHAHYQVHHVGDQAGVLWRSPMIEVKGLIEYLEAVGAVGHGWIVRDGPYGPRVDADDRFTFGGGFPAIAAAAEHERKRLELTSAVQAAERMVLERVRARPLDFDGLRDAAFALHACDTDLEQHVATGFEHNVLSGEL